MKKDRLSFLLLIIGSGIFFRILFYEHGMGLNAVLFCIFLLLAGNLLTVSKPSPLLLLLNGGFFVASLAVVFGHSYYSMVMYWICCVLYACHVGYPFVKHLHFAPRILQQAIVALPSVFSFMISDPEHSGKIKRSNYFFFLLLPLITVILLLVLYYNSSSFFASSFDRLMSGLADFMSFSDFGQVPFILLGALLPVLFYARNRYLRNEQELEMNLVRKRGRNYGPPHLSRYLLRKKQVAIALFVVLNLMILWLNAIDVTHIWFGFRWNGGYLKEMVHEGTNLLIIAILISMAVSLYYLNSRIVFLGQSRLLQRMILLWLLQNGIMVISVCIRNMHYIEYFALAHKRIFVFFFLAACVFGIASIVYKIYQQKTGGFLLSVNAVSVYILLLLAGCFNWDTIIARYNFSHADTAFLHYGYLTDLNDAALPYLITDSRKLKEMDSVQVSKFHFARPGTYDSIQFISGVENRKAVFTQVWEEKGWQDWNYPESKAYHLIRKGE